MSATEVNCVSMLSSHVLSVLSTVELNFSRLSSVTCSHITPDSRVVVMSERRWDEWWVVATAAAAGGAESLVMSEHQQQQQ